MLENFAAARNWQTVKIGPRQDVPILIQDSLLDDHVVRVVQRVGFTHLVLGNLPLNFPINCGFFGDFITIDLWGRQVANFKALVGKARNRLGS